MFTALTAVLFGTTVLAPPPKVSPEGDDPPIAITDDTYGAAPGAPNAPRLKQTAPEFTLPDPHGQPVSLSAARKASDAVLVVFYRGYW